MNDYAFCFRLFEWVSTIAIFLFGTHSVLWTNSLTGSRFFPILNWMSSTDLGIMCMIGGVLRGMMLLNDGYSWAPVGRAVTAAFCCLIWSQFMIILGAQNSPGISVYFALTCGELVSVWRARCAFYARRIRRPS